MDILHRCTAKALNVYAAHPQSIIPDRCMYSKNTPLFVEFDKPKNEITYIKGNIYSFINENNQREYGEFIKQEGSTLS